MIRRTLLTGLVLGLGACAAPYVQSPLTPPADFAGPRPCHQNRHPFARVIGAPPCWIIAMIGGENRNIIGL